MKRIILMLLASGWFAQANSAALSVANGGFESGYSFVGCNTSLIFATSSWHGLTVSYPGSSCPSSTNTIDYPNGYPFTQTPANGCGPAYAGLRFVVSQYMGFYGAPSGKGYNTFVYQQMQNSANSGITYRATAYVKAVMGYPVQGNLGFIFVNTSVGSSANAIVSNVRSQSGSYLTPTFTSVGGGWYKMTVDWTPSVSGNYYMLIGKLSLCDHDNVYTNTWALDEVSINCKADAGPDKSNLFRDACCSNSGCSSVTLGTPATSGFTYSWAPCNGTLSPCTVAQPIANPCTTTNYTVTVSSPSQQCGTWTDVVRVTTSSFICCYPSKLSGGSPLEADIFIYPNPSNGIFTLSYSIPENTTGQIEILDMFGKVVRRYEQLEGENKLEVDNQGIENGVYICTLMIDGQIIKTDKISIIH